ncbi:MAG TPA: hypothetical protein VHB01_08300 [Nitrosospira sp.]|jgi:hypothetical protein|nr:hypothetical protein [Nitrosospira sp.]
MEKIREVTEVHLALLESFPPKLRITAAGTVPTGGWSNSRLQPRIHIQPPPDGIHDFDFVADPPTGPAPQIVSSIQATYTWEELPEGVKGIRVHASQNAKTVLLDLDRPDRQPNRFVLSDCDGITRIEYYPRAFGPLGEGREEGREEEEMEAAADARFEYKGLEGHFVFHGEEISQEQNILGSLLSVTLQPNADAGGLDFALILPPVHLQGEARQTFQTIGIRIRSRGRVINPSGAELAYEVVNLEGVAEDIPIL